ncbi:hypothetical protein EV359DRAFT_74931 [Lentinula novae-zelandiae]|nr:hypothetical protein EV359DRAFT_74931 [Lentinula novae-zelandiae]
MSYRPTSVLKVLIFEFWQPQTSKQVAWIITTTASFVMTIASLPFVWDYFAGRGDVKRVGAFPELAVPANRFFQAYLLTDLSLGAVYYRSQLNLFTGWSHHVIYLGIVEYAIRQKWAHIFCLAACMEFPTFVLGLATLFPRLRSNVFFAVSFFLTRIFFHIVLCITYILPNNRPLALSTLTATSIPNFTASSSSITSAPAPIGSIAPAVLFICVFPMHASWFLGCLKGFKKRAKLRRVIEAKSRSSAASRLPSLETLSSLSPLPSPTFEMLAFNFDSVPSLAKKVTQTLTVSFPTREQVYRIFGLGKRRTIGPGSIQSVHSH